MNLRKLVILLCLTVLVGCNRVPPMVANQPQKPPGLQNGGFEEPLSVGWNAGDIGICRDRMICVLMDCPASGGAERMLLVDNQKDRAPGQYASIAQFIFGVKVGAKYRLSMFVKAKDATYGTAEWFDNFAWRNAHQIPPGTYGWKRVEFEFVAESDPIPLRLVSEGKGMVWIDDVKVEEIK